MSVDVVTGSGAQWPLRCAQCQTMYVCETAIDWRVGKTVVAWFKPKAKRGGCKHDGGVEVWDGEGFVKAEVTPC